MKNLKIAFFAITGLFCTAASAADLYVRDMGAGGAYPTISAAITAASNGDRIIIKPKVGGIPYLENLTIDKSLSFVCETANARYLVQGTVIITPAVSRLVTINNLGLTGSFSTTADSPAGGRTTVNILNSTFSSTLNAGYNNTTLNLSGTTVSGIATFKHGKITGNSIGVLTLTKDTGDVLATTDIFVMGNKITNKFSINSNYKFTVSNNFIYGVVSDNIIYITGIKNNSTNYIQNNYIQNLASTSSTVYVSSSTTNTGIISLLNNIIINTNGSSSREVDNGSGTASVYVFYNIANSGYTFDAVSVTSQASNISSSTITVNTTTYTVNGTQHVNAGYPEPEFQDLDLSLNDIGPFGGSDSWDNYWPTNTTGKPQVFFLDTPRRVYPGTTTIDASATGYSK